MATDIQAAALTPMVVEEAASMPAGTAPMRVAMFSEDGQPVSPGAKTADAVDDVASPDATATASTETVSTAEFAAVVALANETKSKLNELLGNLETAGILS